MTLRELLQLVTECASLDDEVFIGPALKEIDFVETVSDPFPTIKPYVVLHWGDEA